ncbi:Cobalamin biosynthesis protein CobD [Natranaerofaba carboxydovora]|nr:Cobalamin biosynthesis protein CobD [Natranaerofaba carboxydovora]
MLDLLIGDPFGRYHPVCLIGILIDKLKDLAFKIFKTPTSLKAGGVVLALIVIFITYYVSVLLVSIGWWVELLLLYFCISIKSLTYHLKDVLDPLMHGDLDSARKAVGKVVGRDVSRLNDSEVSRAGIETAAESFGDGIMAPLFFGAIGGAPLAMTYKAVNTLDSMIGYKFLPYRDLGYFSAKLDDVLNYIPARLSAYIFLLVGRLKKLNYKKAVSLRKKDASKHPSPNAGQSESVVAGLLEVRLGGLNYYNGEESFRAYMGENQKLPGPHHLKSAINLINISAWMALLFSVVLSLIINYLI